MTKLIDGQWAAARSVDKIWGLQTHDGMNSS